MKEKVLHYSKKVFSHELISGSALYFVGSFVTNIFAFLFNFFVARKLTPTDYGIYASLLSLLTLATLLPQSFSTTIVQFATEYFAKGEKEKAKVLYRQSMLFLSIAGLIFLIGMLILAPAVGAFLHVANIWFVVFVGILIACNFINAVNMSYIQSLLQFGFLSLLQSLGAMAKLFGGVVLVFLGFGVFGALGAVWISTLVPFFLSFTKLQFVFSPTKKSVSISLWEMVEYAIPSMITVIALSSFISSDVLLAKHFLTGQQAGLYAGLSLVAKVIFYFTGIIPAVMFPLLIRNKTKGAGVHNTFYLGLLLVGVPSLFLTLFYFLFPQFVLTFFLGGKAYLAVAKALGLMALFIALFSILSIMVNFFLSLKQTKIVFPVVALALLQLMGISFFHKSIFSIITVSVVTTGILIALLSLYYLYHHRIAKTYTQMLPVPQEL